MPDKKMSSVNSDDKDRLGRKSPVSSHNSPGSQTVRLTVSHDTEGPEPVLFMSALDKTFCVTPSHARHSPVTAITPASSSESPAAAASSGEIPSHWHKVRTPASLEAPDGTI